MNRRNYLKSMAAVPFTPTLVPEFGKNEPDSKEGMSGVWKRRVDEGIVITTEGEKEYQTYTEWRRAAASEARQSSHNLIATLFDFELISIQTDEDRWRSHWAHDCGLEATIREDTTEEVGYEMVVTHVAEKWEEHRHYASDSQIAIANKAMQERDEYL
ncbi:hypothetical protein Har1130_03760 [Haloarcula sp. CBA1130]|uniref:hypothetical protein n=1 Tax=unclassified Haloarcula TaxID=2624677 RepID=UPI0012461599|nr:MULTISPECIES: hypothetical protein [unclassified Haloarcula]KAA9398505.1 hypothetical protein Har1129_09895 [Haloarcula sp. CBA1129]KAA9401903.1 hypothetical protein Har1130_03760 [Haloarcula sp. CBA1130]